MAEPGGNVLAFDLEMNTADKDSPVEDIIQIGWAVGNISTKRVLVSKSMHVKCDKPLSEFITELTGISQIQNNAGYPLDLAAGVMIQDFHHFDCHKQPVVWGYGDLQYLQQELDKLTEHYFQDRLVMPLGGRTQDVKTLWQGYAHSNKISLRRGLFGACRAFGIEPEGDAHDAKYDALNTLRLYFELLELFRR